ncbi:hypothetical protein BU24DRAFT_349940 [Aaosphaeria arxii CBS 175.79]|uniref:Alpha/beta-hydrolase n=1 Tax=Aaosphaeria arxii CBS 175.79 TaxID=1450172 RepID=A0A6A5XLB2_9PLEO|nr:uncharacterized protein BU24DRAFT_349940 [Aaosphaeria arxii CBS 175.79]KAF2014055.1 hypothetical protein BU24DRAFT_349940 [Aaosphaeria arxii CBS 175.79]
MYGLSVLAFAVLAVAAPAPQRNRGGNRNGGGNGGGQQRATAQQQAAQVPGGISQAQDGSTIVDDTVNINGLPIRFKVSAPADQFMANTNIPGAAATAASNGTMGVNVLLHGDGGQSFFDFPNQNVQANTMGVVLLAPDPNLFWGGGQGLERTDGVEHAQAVSDFVTQALPQMVAFDPNAVVFSGVSGGSLLMSGFFIPSQMANFPNSAVELNCGALPPQVDFVNGAQVLSQTKIHYQSTQNELASLQQSIPQAVAAYESAAAQAGLSTNEINQLQTVDNTPQGGHCEFDGRDFVDGVQVMLSSYASVMQGGDGTVQGIGAPSNGQVRNGVVGNENLRFGAAPRRRALDGERMTVMRWAAEVAGN